LRLLLDTHALLWALSGDHRLGRRVTDVIVDPGNQVLFSTVSLWEMAVKVRIGKLEADDEEITDAALAERMELIGISVSHLTALKALPSPHRDPFDHLLIAQAISEDATFVSDDRHVGQYDVKHLRCSDQS
jgi:PIN domain nuclease of toxin-antitoxin system